MSEDKYSTHFENDILTIRVPNQTKFVVVISVGLSLIIRIIFYVALLILTLRLAYSMISESSSTTGIIIGILFLVSILLIFVIGMIHSLVQVYLIARQLWGEEVLEINDRTVRLSNKIRRFNLTSEYPRNSVKAIKTQISPKRKFWFLEIKFGGPIAIVIDQKTIYFGYGLNQEDARAIIEKIDQWFPYYIQEAT